MTKNHMPITEVRQLLTTQQVRQLGIIVLFQVLCGFMEAVSIASLLPILYFILKVEEGVNISVELLGQNVELSLYFTLILILILFCVKYLVSILIVKRQSIFIYGIRESISNKIVASYINQPYAETLLKKTADLIRDINVTVEQFCFNVLNPALLIVADTLIAIGIMGVIFYVSPTVSFVALLYLGGLGFLIVWVTRKTLQQLGEKKELFEGSRIHDAIQAFRGLREIKIYAAETGVLSKFEETNKAAAQVSMQEMYIRQLPRFYLEAAAVSGLLLCIGSFVALSYSGAQIVEILGIFGIAILRLLPGVNRIVVSFQNIRYALPSLNNLIHILKNIDHTHSDKKPIVSFTKSIELIDVIFKYPNNADSGQILGPINLKIAYGDSIAIIGKSGSGKTTLLNIILGMLTPTSGSILIDGVRLDQYILDPKKIGYVAQYTFITNESILKNIAFHRILDPLFLDNAVTISQLTNVIRQKGDASIGEDGIGLSGGERQRLAIARALAAKPEILILDEFTSGLDRETEKAVIDSIEYGGDKNITKIIVTHKLDSSFKCNKIIKLSNGLILDLTAASDLDTQRRRKPLD